MPTAYHVTPSVLAKFKEPFGTLIRGTYSETASKLKHSIEKEKPQITVTVGDAVTQNLHSYGITPQLSITDNKSMRKKIQPQTYPDKTLIKIRNPQGTITQEAITAIQTALQTNQPTHILVDGEEDLLTLIAVLYAPENALIVYGQPNEGLVTVKVTAQKRAEAQAILNAMKTTETK